MARTEQFSCHNCGKPLGWTAPGEAKRMNQRAHVLCDTCRAIPAPLTERQGDFLTVLRESHSSGEGIPSLTQIASKMGVSRSRAQQIRDAIRSRGGTDIDALLGLTPVPHLVPLQPPVTTGAIAMAVRDAKVGLTPLPGDGSLVSSMHDSTLDPAAFGGEFV